VGEYLRYCGLPEGYAWCAAFVSWCHGQAGYAEPRNAWAAALFLASRMVWRAGDGWSAVGDRTAASIPAPRVGDVFGIYYTNLKLIGHCGFVDSGDGTCCIPVDGNTGPDGALGGIGDAAHPVRAGPAREGV